MDEDCTIPLSSKTQLEVLLTCPVCHDIFKDPHQLSCGHSYCMVCLEGIIDFGSNMPFRCPDCRAYFGSTIDVQKSYTLANIAEDFRENVKVLLSICSQIWFITFAKTSVPFIIICVSIELSDPRPL